jgi:hypothetical protein
MNSEVRWHVNAALEEVRKEIWRRVPYVLLLLREAAFLVIVVVVLSVLPVENIGRGVTFLLFSLTTGAGVMLFCIVNLVDPPWKR